MILMIFDPEWRLKCPRNFRFKVSQEFPTASLDINRSRFPLAVFNLELSDYEIVYKLDLYNVCLRFGLAVLPVHA